MHNVLAAVDRSVASFDPTSRFVSAGRTVIALAQLTVLWFTPSEKYFVPLLGEFVEPQCRTAVDRISLYCFGWGEGHLVETVVASLVLISVVVGVLPRLTAVLHWWVSLSISTSFALVDGGEAVAQVATFFLVLICAGDSRTWQWGARTPPRDRSRLTPVSWAGHIGLRAQMAYVYLDSSLSKLAVPDWQQGSAVYYVLRGEFFGAGNWLGRVVADLSGVPVVALTLTWGTIALEVAIAVLLLVRNRWRVIALVLCVLLHLGIVAVVGLWSFGLIMMGAVIVCTAGWQWTRPRGADADGAAPLVPQRSVPDAVDPERERSLA
ncbi:hypothetical protein GMA12_15650 [Kocuria sediminis]|uniref:HTTM-like domain-containing protein n=1 Tax=Kocuria sediminis TaxID=1038857 RepID=A0A6N8GP60_9MICC|nr:hypothetical protein [Kocuria sediminis]